MLIRHSNIYIEDTISTKAAFIFYHTKFAKASLRVSDMMILVIFIFIGFGRYGRALGQSLFRHH